MVKNRLIYDRTLTFRFSPFLLEVIENIEEANHGCHRMVLRQRSKEKVSTGSVERQGDNDL